jgi:hypothetical protein
VASKDEEEKDDTEPSTPMCQLNRPPTGLLDSDELAHVTRLKTPSHSLIFIAALTIRRKRWQERVFLLPRGCDRRGSGEEYEKLDPFSLNHWA